MTLFYAELVKLLKILFKAVSDWRRTKPFDQNDEQLKPFKDVSKATRSVAKRAE